MYRLRNIYLYFRQWAQMLTETKFGKPDPETSKHRFYDLTDLLSNPTAVNYADIPIFDYPRQRPVDFDPVTYRVQTAPNAHGPQVQTQVRK